MGLYYHFISLKQDGPMGSPNVDALLKPRSFSVIRAKRNIVKERPRNTLNRGRNPIQEPIPKLGGREDVELKSMLEHGILLNLQDDTIEEDQ
jgi:hypothetical protein